MRSDLILCQWQDAAKVKNIQKDINVYKLEHYLKTGDSESDQEAFNKVTELWSAYNHALPLGKVWRTRRREGE